jgi:hypothetical protein
VAGSPYAITASNAQGNGLGNYTISYVNGALTVDPAALTAALTGTVRKMFDGTRVATLALSNYTLSGILGSDGGFVALNSPTNGTYASAKVGSGIPVSVSGLALTGSLAGNYVLTSAFVTADIGVITAVPLPPSPLIEGTLFPLTQPQPVAKMDSLTVYPAYLSTSPLYTISADSLP